MQIEKRVVEVFTVDGKEFATEAAAQAYIASQAHVAEFRAFAEEHQAGKGAKAIVMVVNILQAYAEWHAKQDAAIADDLAEADEDEIPAGVSLLKTG